MEIRGMSFPSSSRFDNMYDWLVHAYSDYKAAYPKSCVDFMDWMYRYGCIVIDYTGDVEELFGVKDVNSVILEQGLDSSRTPVTLSMSLYEGDSPLSSQANIQVEVFH